MRHGISSGRPVVEDNRMKLEGIDDGKQANHQCDCQRLAQRILRPVECVCADYKSRQRKKEKTRKH